MTHQSPAEIADQFKSEPSKRTLDEAYFETLLNGVPAHLQAIDCELVPFLDRPLSQVDPVERAILRIGTFELMRIPEVPHKVVINEAIELARDFGAEQSQKFVNGVLDRVARSARSEKPSQMPDI